jgi:4-amino-4-deoxy-L-arabinose transferase-like glycosyltransferase
MQQLDSIQSLNVKRWILFFILMHLLVWTLAPIFVRFNLPLDAIEGSLWGHQLEWGYDKNPFLNGWLTALAVYLGGTSGWMIYLFSQLSVATCFLCVWLLAKEMLPPVFALIAVMILEGVQYYTFHSIDFNDNTLELSLWALTSYFFYRALRSASLRAWILTGIFAAFGMMAKYYTAALLLAMVIFLFLLKENRQQLKTWPPYLGLLVCIVIMLPHMVWLTSHEFITVTYVFQRASSVPSWTNHFFFPAQFAWQQGQAFLPALLLFALVLIGKKPVLLSPPLPVRSFDKTFLWVVGMGPFLLTILLSLVLGIKLRAGWGMPLLSLWGILLVMLCQPALTLMKLYRFMAAVFLLMALLIIGYCVSLIYSNSPSSANFPGREVAQFITQTWHEKYHTPLRYVAGSRWIGGNILHYSSDHPAVFVEWDVRKAPWIDLRDLQKQGAVFVWDIGEGETLPAEVKAKFSLQEETVVTFPWHRNKKIAPVKIGVAILEPEV